MDADADVIAWLRRQGKGHRTRLNVNGLLRAAVMQEVSESRTRGDHSEDAHPHPERNPNKESPTPQP
jgi:hypothetical protein